MSRIYLIRHGNTEANERHLYCGSTDLPLSGNGKTALQMLKLGYSGIRNVQFMTSGMLRTEQTLEILFGTVPHRYEPAFREMDFGAFEMQSYDQLKDVPEYQRWITGDNEANLTPNGESGVLMKARVLKALEELQGTDTVLVTHGGVIATIMEHLFPQEGKNRYEWQPRPGHGYLIGEHGYTALPVELTV